MTKQPKSDSELIGFIVKTSENPTHTKETLDNLSNKELSAIAGQLFKQDAINRKERLKNKPYEVHFTGFSKIDREILINRTNLNKKLKQVESVTQGLKFLVYGKTASEKKIKKAKEQGVKIFKKPEYLQRLETGELL